MATNKQKEQFIEALKFVPCEYRISIYGRGGEVYAGTVDREVYEYFKDNDIDIEEYSCDMDGEMEERVPDNFQPFSPGSPYDCDDIFHVSGASLDNSNVIEICNEHDDVVWSCDLGESELTAKGLTVVCADSYDLDDISNQGNVVFHGAQGEKGTFFDCNFKLSSPFDPKKLTVYYESCDGWDIVTHVTYNGEDLDGTYGYSTDGKWTEYRWVVSNEEAESPEEE